MVDLRRESTLSKHCQRRNSLNAQYVAWNGIEALKEGLQQSKQRADVEAFGWEDMQSKERDGGFSAIASRRPQDDILFVTTS